MARLVSLYVALAFDGISTSARRRCKRRGSTAERYGSYLQAAILVDSFSAGKRHYSATKREMLLGRRYVPGVPPHRQHQKLAIGRGEGGADVAIEVIDLDIPDAVPDEDIDVPVRTGAHVWRVGPRLAQAAGG